MTARQRIEFKGSEGNRLIGDVWDGNGRPVVFLHGGGQTRRAWDMTARQLSEAGLTAITVDQRGHGESDWVPSGNYRFTDFAADATALIRRVNETFGTRPSAVGASLGGLAFLSAEAADRSLLETLVLVDVTPRMNRAGVSKILGFMSERMEDGFASLEDAADAIARYLPHRARPKSLDGLRKNLKVDANGRYRWHWDPAFMTGQNSIDADAERLVIELSGSLSDLSLPILLVRGMQSELVTEADAKDFVSQVPAGQYVDVSGAGHMVAGDRNDAFCSAILDFLVERHAK